MTKNIVISTITPCYRMERYLPMFLEWLPKQTIFDHIEVVLDHNEPTKSEVELVHSFQKKYPDRIKHIIREKVDPIGISMNRCIQSATSDIVAIWNVDDLRTPNSLELQFQLHKNKNVDIACGDFETVTAMGNTNGKRMTCSVVSDEEYTRSMIVGPFFSFRKKACDTIGYFDEQLRSGADFDLAIRLALHGKIKMTPSLLGYYLNEGRGASTRPNSLQSVERTVIELRYGIYDKIDYDLLPQSCQYDISSIYNFNIKYPVRSFIPKYDEFLDDRFRKWFSQGLHSYLLKKSFQYKFFNSLKRNYFSYKYLIKNRLLKMTGRR